MKTRELTNESHFADSARESSEGATQGASSMTTENVIASVETTGADSVKSKARAQREKKLAKKSKSASKAPPIQKRHVTQRYASNTKTGAALKFVKLGAFGGRGARTSAIENAIKSAGAKGATIREIEQSTSAAAVAMHVRTLYTASRGVQYIGRKRDELTGAFKYFALKAPKTIKAPKNVK